ncbi:hypothetical protein, partial [Smaragdicoccus niigatensis]|uniref:hypothetical protein n=2 Tax=Smaragdicoccus niigatensis TaxID=359359 RepID=UPI001C3F428C
MEDARFESFTRAIASAPVKRRTLINLAAVLFAGNASRALFGAPRAAANEFCTNGTTLCGDICVNTYTDPENCGGCGNTCNYGICNSGTCGCGYGLTNCSGYC